MPTTDEMEQILESLMEDLHDRTGTGGKAEEDEPVEVRPDGNDQ